MRALLTLAGALCLACAAAPAEAAAPYPALYVFGDSLSDAGNVYVALGGAEPVAPYFQGRFSNGPVWAQDLARVAIGRRLGPSLLGGHDFAFGGAQSGRTSVHALALNDLPAQLAQYVAAVPNPRTGALYALWIGADDLFAILAKPGLSAAQVEKTEGQVIRNEAAFVAAIAVRGAQNLLLVDIPDLGVVPSTVAAGPQAAAAATALTADFNGKLVATMHGLADVYGLRLTVVDAMGLIDAAVADPTAFGFADATTPCWTGTYISAASGTLCSSTYAVQNSHLFWDGLHPTAHGHAEIAAAAGQALGLQ